LAEWNTFFGKKIAIMPGGGIRSHNIQSIAEVTGLNEFHSAALGLNCQTTDSDQVKNLKSALQF
jgi:copper homeostasis protein CutC